MNIKLELISKTVAELVVKRLDMLEIDVSKIADTAAISALSEIQKVIQADKISDFEAVERIVCILEKYNISADARHDFG